MSAPAAELRRATDLIDAFNEGDWDRLEQQLARDVLYAESGTGRRIEGVAAYLQLCRGWKDAFPDVKGTAGSVAFPLDEVLAASPAYRWTLNHTVAVADGLELFPTHLVEVGGSA